ncbi:MAG: T9SS type A sorting domain-containing protein [Candidatus Latescibacterota bacterium]
MRNKVITIIIFLFAFMAGFNEITGIGAERAPEISLSRDALEKPATYAWPRVVHPLHIVVVFTKWKGEAPGSNLAPSWAKDMFSGQPGSVNDYFDAVSFGQIKVTGEFYYKMVEMPHDTTYYRTSDVYTRDAIRLLDEDPEFDFAKFDNDGLDRIPNSGDDDGFADYIVLMPMSRPYNFILRLATGVMNLNMSDTYYTRDRRAFGGTIMVDKYSGCITVAAFRSHAAGAIIAEVAHAYGAVDLMDKVYETRETDSAGVGYWDLLGHGALGWQGSGITVGPCAYNRMLMNCIGVNNSNLVDIYGVHKGIRVKEAGDPNGKVYRVWVGKEEYFLIEFRSNSGNLYYDAFLPQNGLLIWHVLERESNSSEEMKLCDLECPDGKYRDAGFPMGTFPDPLEGKDNLDFWAHDLLYTYEHNGNLGDASDVYDGLTYTSFGTRTNPSSVSSRTKMPTGIEIYNIRRFGNEMLFDCYIPPLPSMHPHKAPSVGLALQRSDGTSANQYLDIKKSVYLVNFGLHHGADLLITVSGDSMLVSEITFLNQYERHKAAIGGITGNPEIGNISLTRENVPVESFSALIREYGIHLEDLGKGQAPLSIQKVILEENREELPFVLEIRQNYPNPFNAATTIPYLISREGPVVLEIYNVLGQKVLELDQGWRGKGSHLASLTSDGLSSGIFFYRLRGAAVSQTRRFTLIR